MLDLFSGIGGFALAASWVWADRLELVGFCEIDPYCQQVLANRWPKVPIFEDIKQLSADQFQDIDLITGGFPCQDISVAGQGRGLEGERSGLWFEMLRLIGRIRPRYALIENVPMLIHRGLGRVLCDLTQVGYDAEWQVISAAEVGAPHLRQRIWVVAYPDQSGLEGRDRQILPECASQQLTGPRSSPASWSRSFWQSEPDVGRVADGVPRRVDRLKSLGNAIVPQCAALIMNQIRRNDEF